MRALLLCLMAALCAAQSLEEGWKNPPQSARPHTYWLWLNGYVDAATARAELQAMKDAGFGGVLLFDMGARGEKSVQPPAGPAFLSPEWMKQFKESVTQARSLGLQVDFSVVSSWDLGGHWIQPQHGSMGLYPAETVASGRRLDVELTFPAVPAAAPKGSDGKPTFWREAAVLAVKDARRGVHEFVIRLDPIGEHELADAVLDNGNPGESPITKTMSPVREFSVAVSDDGLRFRDVVTGSLPRSAGPQKFAMPAGTKGRYVRLRLLNAHDADRPRWTLGDFAVHNRAGLNVVQARVADTTRNGGEMVRSTAPFAYGQEWNLQNLHDLDVNGPRGVFATAGPAPFVFGAASEAIDVTRFVTNGRLKWEAPSEGQWTILRYVVMNTGERLKVPSPNSDGWATDHLNAEATRAHMDYVVDRLKETFGDVKASGLRNLYLASYEVVGPVWSPGFIADFKKRRGYDMTPYVPAIFGSTVKDQETTERFLFDYRKTLGELLVDAYYVASREVAHKAGLGIKSEAGGPGPPVHNVPVDSLLANAAVDEIQGEFWPFWPDAHGLWVVKETASAGHVYGKRVVHLEAFTSFEGWREGPQDLKASADRVFAEGGNHMVWHTWSHAPVDAPTPGAVYLAGTHINRKVTWWPKVRPFIDYLSRASFLLQQGLPAADILYYYGDGGYRFVPPKHQDPARVAGYDNDHINSDALLNRVSVKNGRFVLPDGTNYAVLVLPDEAAANPKVLARIEELAKAGGTVVGKRPTRAAGLEGGTEADALVRTIAARLPLVDKPVAEVLKGKGIGPDVVAPESMDWVHRTVGTAEVYFVRNRTGAPVQAAVTFRVKDRVPEFWDAVTGAMSEAPAWRRVAGTMEVPVELAANGSVFVIFRKAAGRDRQATAPASVTSQRVAGPWTIEIAGRSLKAEGLGSWTRESADEVKHFAGTARYKTTFQAKVPRGKKAVLDLGNLWTLGEAWLNGKPLGVTWTAPFTLDATGALKDGTNELVVEVTNTWYNRLVGDAKLPPEKRTTKTNVTSSGGKPWAQLQPLDSGLFGPVEVRYK